VDQVQRFELAASLYDRCRALSRYLVSEAQLASWYFVGLKGGEGSYLMGAARQALLHLGGTIAGTTALDLQAASFGSLLAQIAKARPHLVFLALGEPLLSRFLAAMEHASELAAVPVSGPFPPLAGDGLAFPSKLRAIWPALWHPTLVQGGAVQLNQRFQARWKQPMGPYAWMGWVGVKAVTELALRAPAGADLAQGLARLQFDGHKALPLHFDFNHFLRQPIYLVGRKAGESAPGPLALLGQVMPEPGS
jgi:ABC-type branched-subunit amino acid transport system substrate-binding protein